MPAFIKSLTWVFSRISAGVGCFWSSLMALLAFGNSRCGNQTRDIVSTFVLYPYFAWNDGAWSQSPEAIARISIQKQLQKEFDQETPSTESSFPLFECTEPRVRRPSISWRLPYFSLKTQLMIMLLLNYSSFYRDFWNWIGICFDWFSSLSLKGLDQGYRGSLWHCERQQWSSPIYSEVGEWTPVRTPERLPALCRSRLARNPQRIQTQDFHELSEVRLSIGRGKQT